MKFIYKALKFKKDCDFQVVSILRFKYKQKSLCYVYIKVELLPSKKVCFIFFNESPLKMTKNAYYFILKALFVLMVFEFLSFW